MAWTMRSVMERIFELYFTTKGPDESTGMGLSVAHGIVRSHSGNMTVYSEPGKGTTFHVYLPRIDTTAITPETVSTEPAPNGKNRILLVDDEVQIVHMVQQMLEPRLPCHGADRRRGGIGDVPYAIRNLRSLILLSPTRPCRM